MTEFARKEKSIRKRKLKIKYSMDVFDGLCAQIDVNFLIISFLIVFFFFFFFF